jgi:hypothetical protein
MKWRRGFFRLWVIFAASWLAGIARISALVPEYADLADKKLTSALYQKAGIPLKEAEPIKAIGELLLIGVGIPLLLLGVGFVLAWALRGFSTAH